jgi:hypothetical protein
LQGAIYRIPAMFAVSQQNQIVVSVATTRFHIGFVDMSLSRNLSLLR